MQRHIISAFALALALGIAAPAFASTENDSETVQRIYDEMSPGGGTSPQAEQGLYVQSEA